jgi:hypothetical protein
MKKLILSLAVPISILLATPRATAQVKMSFPAIGQTMTSPSSPTLTHFLASDLHFSAQFILTDSNYPGGTRVVYDASPVDSTFQSWRVSGVNFAGLPPGLHMFKWVVDYGNEYGPYPFLVGYPTPTLTSISTTSVLVGSAGFTLTATGTNFSQFSTIQWAGWTLKTDYVSATSLKATLPADLFATAGPRAVTVLNPAPGGGTSATITFNVNNPVPTLTSISPTSAVHGSAALTLTVTGSNFNTQSKVLWNGSFLLTTYVSATSLKATVSATQLLTAGTATVTVNNPAPGGGTTAGKTFTIQ